MYIVVGEGKGVVQAGHLSAGNKNNKILRERENGGWGLHLVGRRGEDTFVTGHLDGHI